MFVDPDILKDAKISAIRGHLFIYLFHTKKADIGLLIFAWICMTSWPKMGVFGDTMGKEWCDVDPQRTRSYF